MPPDTEQPALFSVGSRWWINTLIGWRCCRSARANCRPGYASCFRTSSTCAQPGWGGGGWRRVVRLENKETHCVARVCWDVGVRGKAKRSLSRFWLSTVNFCGLKFPQNEEISWSFLQKHKIRSRSSFSILETLSWRLSNHASRKITSWPVRKIMPGLSRSAPVRRKGVADPRNIRDLAPWPMTSRSSQRLTHVPIFSQWVPRSVHVNQGPKTLGQIRSEASEEYPNLLFEAPNAKSASARSSGGHVKNHQSAAGLGFFPMSKKQQYGEQMPLVAWLAIDTGKFVICYCRHGIEQGATFYRERKKKLRPICFCFIF